MFALSQSTGYAILALACLHRDEQGMKLTRDIARCTAIPRAYLSKILHALSKAGLIKAKRGYRGGFALRRHAAQITFDQVARAIEGDDYLPACMMGLGACLQRADCPGRAFWQEERQRILSYLCEATLADVPDPCTACAAEADEADEADDAAAPRTCEGQARPCLGRQPSRQTSISRGPSTRSRS